MQNTTNTLRLEQMAPHIAFEFSRFKTAADPQMFLQPGEHGGLIREAFLLHFRNLIDFFYGEGKGADDVLASDYMNQPSAWVPNIPSWLGEYKRRCNKLLAHLTYERIAYKGSNDMVWNLEGKIQHISREWASFLEAMPDRRRAWFVYRP